MPIISMGRFPVQRQLEKHEIENYYEYNTGEVLVETFVAEEISYMILIVRIFNLDIKQISQYLLDKNYSGKHGTTAYYDQK